MKASTKFLLGGLATGTAMVSIAGGVATLLAGRFLLRQLRQQRALLPLRLRDRRSARAGGDLRGEAVLITGSSRGLGLALAEEFARAGCKLVLCARNEHELARARQRVERLGAEVCAVPCDVGQHEQVEHLVRVARQHFGSINILVNNAGTISVGPLAAQTTEDFREAMDTIFWGTVYPTLAILPAMIESGRGRIVNITSVGGRISLPHTLPYNCAKFATVGFSEGLHAEVKRFGIHVLTVVPGLMRTGSHLNARFKGNAAAEYRWFAAGATNPFLSMSAERAAAKIVEATSDGQAELTLGWPTKTLLAAHQISPALTTEALALVNRVLPKAPRGPRGSKSGRELDSRSGIHRGRRSAQRYNQIDEAA